MAKIDLSNISHSYNPNDPNPGFGSFGLYEWDMLLKSILAI